MHRHEPITLWGNPATATAAIAYAAAGLSVLPIRPDGSKAPALHTWKPYQSRIAGPAEIAAWFADRRNGVGVVAGRVSGGLEVFDCDDTETAAAWEQGVEGRAPLLLARLPRVRTPRPGLHVYLRRAGGVADHSRVLARNPDPATGAPRALIETRGEGGYAVAPPSPPACHPLGRPYVLLDGPPLTDVPVVTDAEYAALVAAAAALDRIVLVPRSPTPRLRPVSGRSPVGSRPGDVFAAAADWDDVLGPFRWVPVGVTAGGTEYWRRPGKSSGVSATVNHGGTDRLYVFTASAPPLEPGRWYGKFEAYALLWFRGDFRAAARSVRRPNGRPAGRIAVRRIQPFRE